MVDDSIVRGTTSLKIVDMMRQAGAREVHMRIASPPTRHSCFYGVDTPERSKLLAARMDIERCAAISMRTVWPLSPLMGFTGPVSTKMAGKWTGQAIVTPALRAIIRRI
nr:hypothetical protein [Iodidimonas gelatinilytica]